MSRIHSIVYKTITIQGSKYAMHLDVSLTPPSGQRAYYITKDAADCLIQLQLLFK